MYDNRCIISYIYDKLNLLNLLCLFEVEVYYCLIIFKRISFVVKNEMNISCFKNYINIVCYGVLSLYINM